MSKPTGQSGGQISHWIAPSILSADCARLGEEADGGIKVDNIAAAAKAGADSFVAGSAIFGSRNYAATIAAMRAAIIARRA